jgi:hypothetical protein
VHTALCCISNPAAHMLLNPPRSTQAWQAGGAPEAAFWCQVAVVYVASQQHYAALHNPTLLYRGLARLAATLHVHCCCIGEMPCGQTLIGLRFSTPPRRFDMWSCALDTQHAIVRPGVQQQN